MGNTVQLSAGGARVTLEPDGDIILDPVFGREVHVQGNMRIEGNLKVEKDLDIQGDLTIEKDVDIKGNLTVKSINGVSFP